MKIGKVKLGIPEQMNNVFRSNFYYQNEIRRVCLKVFGSLSLYSPLQQKGGHSETLLNTCIEHSNGAYLHLSNDDSDLLSGDFDNKNQ